MTHGTGRRRQRHRGAAKERLPHTCTTWTGGRLPKAPLQFGRPLLPRSSTTSSILQQFLAPLLQQLANLPPNDGAGFHSHCIEEPRNAPQPPILLRSRPEAPRGPELDVHEAVPQHGPDATRRAKARPGLSAEWRAAAARAQGSGGC